MDEKKIDEELTEEEKKEESEEEIAEDKKEDEQKEESLKNSLMRLQADFTNYKKRVEREKSQQIKLANEGLIMKLLPILDDLDRAIENSKEHKEISDGMKLICDSFYQILKSEGLEEIPSDGESFDPNVHHAVVTEDSDEGSDKVLETFQKGYRLHDKVIRPAMVKVSK